VTNQGTGHSLFRRGWQTKAQVTAFLDEGDKPRQRSQQASLVSGKKSGRSQPFWAKDELIQI